MAWLHEVISTYPYYGLSSVTPVGLFHREGFPSPTRAPRRVRLSREFYCQKHEGVLLFDRKQSILDRLWREFFENPSLWWDERPEKVNPRYPDFIHKKKKLALWLNNDLTPPWVEAKLVAMAPDVEASVFAWNRKMQRCLKVGRFEETIRIFQQMERKGIDPNKFTFVPVLNACSKLGALKHGEYIHEQVIRAGHESDVYVSTCLVDMYAKCGSIEDARTVFNKMPTRNVVSWNAMITGYVKCGDGKEALELLWQMQRDRLEPNHVTFMAAINACASLGALDQGRHVHEQMDGAGCEINEYVGSSLIHMYAKCGSIEDARRVFNKVTTRDVVAWNAMIAAYGMHGCAREALELFKLMSEVVEVDGATFISLLSACSHERLVDEGMLYFKSMSAVYNILPTVKHFACVIDLLGRAGWLHQAEDLIRGMPCEPDVYVWTSLLRACRTHSKMVMADRVSKRVLELDPQNVPAFALVSKTYAP